jgi:Zn-dependent M16 (insulinase) family peptidase
VLCALQLEGVVQETQALKERQETPDSPEALTCMPSLQLSDIKKSITKVPTAISDTAGGSKLLAHELFTNDVLYAEAALDMSGMPAHLLPLVPLFCRSLTQVCRGVV